MNKGTIFALFLLGVFYMKKQDITRGIANNNPLNIRENKQANDDWVGEHEFDIDKDFEEFESPVYGIRAAARLLKNYRDKYGKDTIASILNKWAPADENDTESYIKSVTQKMNINRDEILSDYDYPDLIKAMIYHENGQQPYTDQQINNGFEMGFYS